MCGICGIIDPHRNRDIRNEVVRKMNNAIRHRGPDEDGFFSDLQSTLAMRRLSIIDLNTGKQPIFSNDGNFLIFFNGEIYNYKSLRTELEKKGFVFKTSSDTEVLVNLYQCFGVDMFLMLRGMFALCIYDLNGNRFIFARDRFGEKPFFYYHNREKFFFSSELNSLLEADHIPRKLNRSMLSVYLQRSYVPEPETLFEGIKTLPPGHYLIFEKGAATVSTFFQLTYRPDSGIKSIEDAAEVVKPVLENAVRRQMISDVPIGAFLSGGIDSSTVVALMQRLSDDKIKTFNVKFQTASYDESKIARKVAGKIGTEHHEIVVENSRFEKDQFWKILKHVGVPFPDSSAIPTDIVTSAIAKHVKVALSGDGGDELFGGYAVFDWFGSIMGLRKVPAVLRMPARAFGGYLNEWGVGGNKLRLAIKALRVAELQPKEILPEMHALFDRFELEALFNEHPTGVREEIYTGFDSLSELRKAMYYRVKYDLPLDMLTKVDRMSMSNSLEVRNPFLDPDLFDVSCTLPDQFLRKKGKGKLVLRQIMGNLLPKDVFNHPKTGFSIPLHDFKNQDFRDLANDLVLNQGYMTGLFDKNILEKIFLNGINDIADSNKGSIYRKTHQLWSLMMLSGWVRMYGIEV